MHMCKTKRMHMSESINIIISKTVSVTGLILRWSHLEVILRFYFVYINHNVSYVYSHYRDNKSSVI